jgi:hypothetical protein
VKPKGFEGMYTRLRVAGIKKTRIRYAVGTTSVEFGVGGSGTGESEILMPKQ